MAPKEPTRQQLSSRLTYQSKTPAFLLKLQKQVGGRAPADDEYEPQIANDEEGELDEFGRERRRPPVTETPKNEDPYHSDEEDAEDEKPVIVVVKEGKHLSEREVENENRKAKGLEPLRHEDEDKNKNEQTSKATVPQTKLDNSGGLSFSSKKNKPSGNKRKVLPEETDKPTKKVKKPQKGPLSFDRNDMS